MSSIRGDSWVFVQPNPTSEMELEDTGYTVSEYDISRYKARQVASKYFGVAAEQRFVVGLALGYVERILDWSISWVKARIAYLPNRYSLDEEEDSLADWDEHVPFRF